MSAEFLPLYRLCGTSISSMAHSWKGRLYSVNRFQSAYARRTMILPFSSSRSSTSFSSNCLYCASLTPRAMFSKSMNIASFRSPFIQVVLSSALLSRGVGWVSTASIICPSFGPPGRVYDLPHEKARSRRGRPGAARPGPDREVARPDIWPHAPLRSQTLDLPLLRPGGAPDVVDVGGVPAPAADHRALRRPLRHALVEARQRVGGRLRALARRAGDAAGGGGVRAPARGSRLHDQHAPRRSAGRRRGAGGEAQREGSRARPRRPDAPGAAEALLLEVVEVAARLRVPRREPARLLGAERLPHARRPVEGGALLRSGDARDAADARRSRAHAARAQLMAVRVEHAGAVTTIVLDRPESRNAVDRDTAAALADAFRACEADVDARVAVLWGDGGTFCAGADLKAIGSGRGNRLESEGDGPMGPSRMLLSKPTIAAVAGYAVAGGLELALWCDLRVLEEDAVLGVFCRRWGVPLVDGGTVRLPRLIGLSRALDLILTGRPVDAREAERIGLANRVVAKGHARAAAEALAAEIAAFPPRCVLSDRRSAYESAGGPLEVALRRECELGRATIDAGESRDGAARFAAGAGRHGTWGPRHGPQAP